MTEGSALRYDTGKLRLDLIPPEWIEELGRVLTKGAEKYAPRNWEKGMDWDRIAGSMLRHYISFKKGEKIDEETGCHHMAMVAWNALALMYYDMKDINSPTKKAPVGPDLFDLYEEKSL